MGAKAKEEHDAFAEALRDKGVQVHYYGQLLAETLELPRAGRSSSTGCARPRSSARPSSIRSARLFEDLDGTALAEFLDRRRS